MEMQLPMEILGPGLPFVGPGGGVPMSFDDDVALSFGDDHDCQMVWSTDQTPDAMMIGISGDMNIIITDKANIGKDHSLVAHAHPYLAIYSNSDPTVNADEYIGIYADGTDGNIEIGAGLTNLNLPQCEMTEDVYVNTNKAIRAVDVTKAMSFFIRSSLQTAQCGMILLGSDSRNAIISTWENRAKNHALAASAEPMVAVFSTTDPTGGDATEHNEIQWNNISIGGSKGSFCGLKSVEEEITITVGQGLAGVDSSADLCPANSYIKEVVTRITQAPGGGATALDAGRKNGGNLDEYTDGTAVALGTTTIANDDGDGNTAIPHWNSTGDKITLTTDANVTGTDMKVRVVVFYEEVTVPTA